MKEKSTTHDTRTVKSKKVQKEENWVRKMAHYCERKRWREYFGALVVFKRTLRLDLPDFKSELFHSIP